MRIAFVLPSFATGGAERVASLLCNAWAQHGHTVMVATFESPGEDSIYTLRDDVLLHQIDAVNQSRTLTSRLIMNCRRVVRLRSALREFKPTAVIAFMTEANVVTLWASSGLGIPVVVSERNQPDRPGLGISHRLARRMTYPMAAALVVQTGAIADWARQRFRIPVHIIPNPVHLTAPVARPAEGSEKRLVAAGRLAPQKGFDVLIASFARLAADHPEWRLYIYGEGAERDALTAQISSLSLTDRIFLPGIVKDLSPVYAGASLFVLPSRYEGFPNALLEALASGCPVIATDCPGASSDILQGGRYGLLVPPDNIEALTSALGRMMADEPLRATYSNRAREAVMPFEEGLIARQWLDLFEKLGRS
jgi:GalNAc-alpha-(1->4)-GalNAc-alpha-(1->3)-diNAcBac-PP-undecaprenol alpha-1,4-N-acetyl-D-galactosaminyltransferase